MDKKLNILVCPLNWGLGHASRDIPIINELINNKHNVIIAGSENILTILKSEFPKLQYVNFKGLKISYPKEKSFFFHFLFRIIPIIISIIKENNKLKEIINNHNIDIVISDNRFGLWNKKIYSVFITHQINIKIPTKIKFLAKLVFKANSYFINKYDVCWIPDFEKEPSMAGELSHNFSNLNVKYIGNLSKFNFVNNNLNNVITKYEIIAIISGPEPHRSIFEELLINQLTLLNKECLLVIGKPLENNNKTIGKLTIVSHLSTTNLLNAINSSKYIISRSGYTTIMDLIALKRTAILVPTPGQTEQEYLAEYCSKKKMFYCVTQDKFNVTDAITNVKSYSIKYEYDKNDLLMNAINEIEENCKNV